MTEEKEILKPSRGTVHYISTEKVLDQGRVLENEKKTRTRGTSFVKGPCPLSLAQNNAIFASGRTLVFGKCQMVNWCFSLSVVFFRRRVFTPCLSPAWGLDKDRKPTRR